MLVCQRVAIFDFCHVGRDNIVLKQNSPTTSGFATSLPVMKHGQHLGFFFSKQVGISIEFDILSLYHILGCSPHEGLWGSPTIKIFHNPGGNHCGRGFTSKHILYTVHPLDPKTMRDDGFQPPIYGL